jgi:hypothetical protein
MDAADPGMQPMTITATDSEAAASANEVETRFYIPATLESNDVIAMQEPAAKPWYKEPWPFILISITGLGVIAGSTLAFIGLSNPPEIVSGDYEQLCPWPGRYQ